jgi:DNA modification methylase
MTGRVETIGECTLYLGDCRDILPTLGKVDAVVTDPPYGILNLAGGTTSATRTSRRVNAGRFSGTALGAGDYAWDDAPDAALVAAVISAAADAIIWGGNYFDLPPARGILVWDKEQPWPNFSQAEIAWTTLGRPAALYRVSSGKTPDKQHPTQKPVELMAWCLGFLPAAQTILDPFMGSGTTGVACVNLGRSFIGIEREAKYFDAACRRIAEAYRQPRLFAEPVSKPVQTAFDLEGAQ